MIARTFTIPSDVAALCERTARVLASSEQMLSDGNQWRLMFGDNTFYYQPKEIETCIENLADAIQRFDWLARFSDAGLDRNFGAPKVADWSKDIVRKTLEGAGEFPGVQLPFLLMRLEDHPETIPAIADEIRDMGQWYFQHAQELEAEARRRNGGANVVDLPNTEK